ncbi:uncharacterized protein BJ171DRAFT_568756 [Polychytrium aggregatum]|uniref:uncharacterized protein n=1 Tax=Polychytrium aggregatum TaxID=110093 RepID=UPI0022FE8B8D|nr:uncharacterized protein BJ171DRAFT_568756 [Polychytrium aggregatum]KAI9203635.1 hypothetical protein BJ171DRAFT_568756 [Polychytrium aggregatum]
MSRARLHVDRNGLPEVDHDIYPVWKMKAIGHFLQENLYDYITGTIPKPGKDSPEELAQFRHEDNRAKGTIFMSLPIRLAMRYESNIAEITSAELWAAVVADFEYTSTIKLMKRFETFIMAKSQRPGLTVDEVIGDLRWFGSRIGSPQKMRKFRSETSQAEAAGQSADSAYDRQKSTRPQCARCGRKNHVVSECFAIRHVSGHALEDADSKAY